MDVARKPPRKTKKYVLAGVGLAAVLLLTFFIKNLEPAPPTVERGTLWVDTVKRGPMVRQVRGPGTLVPEQIHLISAVTAGRIESLPLRAGAHVSRETMLMELSNPDVQLQALESQRQLASAEAELVNLRTNLETQRLNQEGTVSQLRTQYREAQRQAELNTALGQKGLASTMEVTRFKEAAEDLKERVASEEQRLQVMKTASTSQLALQKQQVERMRAVADFQQSRIESMKVKAGDEGVLQEMNLELGQWVTPGFVLAKVAQPGRLKAVLRIPETQAKDITVGQPASIDTHNGVISGKVIRMDPAAVNGTVTIDVSLEGELPKGARPDLSVDGTVEIDRLDDAVFVGRPAYGQSESTIGLFRVDPDGKTASRVNVKLGRSSVNTIEILGGLKPGDKVIISDMSAYDNFNKVRLR